MPLEEMNSFFDARVKDYEEYVRQEADGAQDYYRETAKLIPKRKRLSLVDLGVGTGLELDEIFQQNPGVTVTGILAVGFSLCRSRRAVGHHIGLPQTHDSDNLR